MIKSEIKYQPIKYIVAFNIFTLILFVTAPIVWATDNLFIFCLLFLACQFALFIGFKFGVDKCLRRPQRDYGSVEKYKKFIFVFYCCTFLIKYAYLLRFYPHQIGEMINFLMIGIASPQLGYQMSLDASRGFTIPWSVFALISIVNQIFFIVGFLTWKSNTKLYKVLFAIFLAIELFYWFGRGTNFGVINLLTTMLFAILVNQSAFKKVSLGQKLKQTIIIAVVAIFSLSIFTYNLVQRSGTNEIDYSEFRLGRSVVNEQSEILRIIPDAIIPTYLYGISYLCQGYYHTCLAFNLDFEFSYFFGNNPESISIAEIIGIDVADRTYVERLSGFGVDPRINWHSIYTWLASDFSFFLLPIVFLAFGMFMGYAWMSSKLNNDLLSKIIFIALANILFFSFANNNYLVSIFYSFSFLFVYWFFRRFIGIKL